MTALCENAASEDLLCEDRSAPRPDMRDLAPYPLDHRLVQANLEESELQLRWDDGRSSRFNALWLHDNCPCPQCRHPQTMERTFLLLDADTPRLKEARVIDGGHLETLFTDGHRSRFDAGWLRAQAHHGWAHDDWTLAERRQPPDEWDSGHEIPRHAYDRVMDSEAGLAAWLESLLQSGIAIVSGAPAVPGTLLDVIGRVQAPKVTNFGTVFEVFSKPDPNSSAYTSMALEPHADLVNWACPPDFQALFCIENASGGGRSIFVNAMTVTRALREADPEAFRRLSEVPVAFRFQDETCDLRHLSPVIELDREGGIRRLRFNNWLRDQTHAPPAIMAEWYAAYLRLWRLIRDPRFQIRPQLAAGELVVFDNVRVLHGREAYDANAGRRHLEGCYLDRDWIASRLRLAGRKG